jgi:hypothetical protein
VYNKSEDSKLNGADLASPAGVGLGVHLEITRSGRRKSRDGGRSQLLLQAVQDVLPLDRHGDLSLIGALLCLVVVFLQPDAVSDSLH